MLWQAVKRSRSRRIKRYIALLVSIKIVLITSLAYGYFYSNTSYWFNNSNITDKTKFDSSLDDWLKITTIDKQSLNNRLAAGYRINNYFTTEIGYGYVLGKLNQQSEQSNSNLISLRRSTDVSTKLIWPFNHIETHADIGMSYLKTVDELLVNKHNNNTVSNFAPRYELGLDINVNQYFTTSAELVYMSQTKTSTDNMISSLNCTFYLS